ncbi:ankyrin repeat domain-containing protein [Hephaestia sp. GCM10023244]|uniref:ankyrin repeat domain-containing protein n=1 Tax=unclassified Hephaestia TaxID=2631281 RepID=UPI0020774517|nr:ankyrin repeat domain-containing protein [Hephaestia sp. MAHUQ-44]MCM8731167.1 ankyrin repeat domain-containing protein [Hephaestia sp. MAHUQ-44]
MGRIMSLGFIRIAFAGALLAAATGAHAQLNYSEGYKFLEAVRDAKGQDVTDLLAKPGTTVIDARDRKSGEGALHIVIKRNDPTYVRFLLEHGANPDIRDNQGTTPLMLAITQNAAACVTALLNPPKGGKRADVNLANGSGETPLIRAVQLRNLDLVRTLLKAGANPDQADHLAGLSARDYARNDKRSPALLQAIETTERPGRTAVSGPTL